jgi:hypothetical protein
MKERKERKWSQLTREEKLSSVLYPNLIRDPKREAEMRSIAKGEGKRAPASSPLLSDRERGSVSPMGGQAKDKR